MTQQEALEILKLGHNVYLTGPAGSGKTHTLNTYISYLKKYGVEVGITASTGIAATHMNGVTIHSWAGLGIKNFLSEEDLDALQEKEYLFKRFQKTKVLVIDEVSMLHDFRLDMVERVCRAMKRNEEPFGGMQVILSGDFFQLPPISKRNEPEARFVYHSDAWKAMDLRVCYLEEQFRQTGEDFALQVLNDIRANDVTEDTLDHLRRRYKRAPKLPGAEDGKRIIPTKLYTHNIDVDAINDRELESLEGGTHVYEMRSKGKNPLVETLKKSCLAPERLVLKEGAQVMFVKNNFDAGYVNGTLGTVVGFDKMDAPIVETLSSVNGTGGKRITVEETDWSIDEEGKVKAEITQLPLRLAWAITVHKSQGMSLDAVEVDLSKSFVPGMGYVALSRVRTLGGLKLLGLNQVAMQVDPRVLQFDQELRKLSERAADELAEMDEEEKEQGIREYLDSISPTEKERREKEEEKAWQAEKKIPTHEKTRALVQQKLSLTEIAQARGVTEGTIIGHLEKLLAEDADMDISYLKPKTARMKKITDAFKKANDTKLTPVKQLLGNSFTFDELRLARLFL
ncbi:MAG TPA: helix-turn-helix domain-containing protein [Candidatus Paceibacterota bacterium]|nr:helix-turn-helix domain-containing protein [Candidatus Paceibacterota bacterium]